MEWFDRGMEGELWNNVSGKMFDSCGGNRTQAEQRSVLEKHRWIFNLHLTKGGSN